MTAPSAVAPPPFALPACAGARWRQAIRRRFGHGDRHQEPADTPSPPSRLSREMDRATADARSMLAGLPPVEPPFWRRPPAERAAAAATEVTRER